MRTLLAAALGAAALIVPAAAPPVPTSGCEIAEMLGFENVKECEDGTS
jgi:hypothetical protein